MSSSFIATIEKLPKLEADGSNYTEWWTAVSQWCAAYGFGDQLRFMNGKVPLTSARNPQCIFSPLMQGSSGGQYAPVLQEALNVTPDQCINGYIGTLPKPMEHKKIERAKPRAKSPVTRTSLSAPGKDDEKADEAEAEAEDQLDPGVVELESVDVGNGVEDTTKYGYYPGDPLAKPLLRTKAVQLTEVIAAEEKFNNANVQIAACMEKTLTAALTLKLRASPLYLQAIEHGRPDVAKHVVDHVITTSSVVAVTPRAWDPVILSDMRALITYKPKQGETFVEIRDKFHEMVRRLRLKGWDAENSSENDCFLGVILWGLGKTSKNERLMREELDKDTIKHPTCTVMWAESKVLEIEAIVARSSLGDQKSTEHTSIRAAHHQGGGRGGGGRGRGDGRGSAGRGGRGKQAGTSNNSTSTGFKWTAGEKQCRWCNQWTDHYTAFCPDPKCPDSVKDEAKELFKQELAAKRNMNALKKSNKD